MSRITEEEREAIRRAAESAASIVQKLEKERDALQDRIDRLKSVIEAWEGMSGKRLFKTSNNGTAETVLEKPVRGQVSAHIDAILETGGEFKESELRMLIAERFHIIYGRSTVYSTLCRGQKANKYEHDGKKWRLTKRDEP